jgi:hypothetical protein
MFLIMFTLKLCGTIAISWWLVTAPLLVFVAIPVLFLGGLVVFLCAIWVFAFGAALLGWNVSIDKTKNIKIST